MGSHWAELRLVAGRVLLAVIVAWSVWALAISASFLWTTRGTFGFQAGYGGHIVEVDPGSPAALAGIQRGDMLDLARTPADARPYVAGVTAPVPPDARVRISVVHDGIPRDVALTASAFDLDPPSRISLVFSVISTAVFILVGAGLIFLRQSIVTWGFGLFCLLTNPVIPALARFPSPAAHLVYVVIYDIVQNVGVIGLLAFSLNFPKPLKRPWREWLWRLLPLLFVVLAAWTLWIDIAVCVLGQPVWWTNRFLQMAFGLVDIVAIALITETYFSGPREDRARLRWVLIGYYVGLVGNFIGNTLLYTASITLPIWIDNLLIALVVTLPLAVGYAVVRHRVLDIDFFISRAIVYALFTALLLLIFAVIDWLFSRLLADFRLSLLVEAMASIGAAIAFDGVHNRVERTVDELLFRGRRIARERLERTARAVHHVGSPAALDLTLVEEPHQALNLVSVALFRSDGNAYRRVAACGWATNTVERLDIDDRLVLEHRAERGIITLASVPWQHPDLPHGVARPTVSIPLATRERVEGFLLCSGTAHGEQLDPEESQWLEHLVNAAAASYEEIDAERLRERVSDAEREVTVLTARLDEARRSAAPLER